MAHENHVYRFIEGHTSEIRNEVKFIINMALNNYIHLFAICWNEYKKYETKT